MRGKNFCKKFFPRTPFSKTFMKNKRGFFVIKMKKTLFLYVRNATARVILSGVPPRYCHGLMPMARSAFDSAYGSAQHDAGERSRNPSEAQGDRRSDLGRAQSTAQCSHSNPVRCDTLRPRPQKKRKRDFFKCRKSLSYFCIFGLSVSPRI